MGETRSSARERLAIVFMTMSAIATLVLGAALIAQLGKTRQQVIEVSVAPRGPASNTAGGDDNSAEGAASGDTISEGSEAHTGATTTRRRVERGGRAGAATGSAGQPPASGSTAPTGSPADAAAPPGSAPPPSTPRGGGKGPDNPAQGVTAEFITVGGIFDETGPVDATVERDTVRAYFNKVNAEGGVRGRKLRLVDCDSAFDPSRGHQCSQRLISQGILAMVGWTSPSSEQPETAYLTRQGVPMIGGLSVPAQFESPLAFPTMASLVVHGQAMATRAAELNFTAPGIIIINVNFVAPVRDALLRSLHDHGIQETSVEEVDATKADYTDVIVKLRSTGAKSVIAALDPFSYARMFQAMQRQNWHPPVLGFGLDKRSANEAYGRAVHGAHSLIPFLEAFDPAMAGDPGVAEYLSTVRRYYPDQVRNLDVYTEAQWVAAKVFVEALRRIDGPVNRQTLVAALHTLRSYQPGLVPSISYEPGNHDPNRCFRWLRNQEGIWRTVSDWRCF